MAPDNVLDAYATPRRRSQTIRTPHWSVKNPKFFARETRAYRQTAPALGRGSVPRLVVTNPSGRGTAPDRRIQAGTDVAPADSGAAARRAPAGRYLAEPLPRRPARSQPQDYAEAAAEAARAVHSAERHLEGAEDLIGERERETVRRHAAEVTRLGPLPRGYVHGDFQELH
jgi:hypothetical protein